MTDNIKDKLLPETTVERLSEYRRTLLRLSKESRTHIFSHELGGMHSISAVQVRRDLMLIGFSRDTNRGYDVIALAEFISEILDSNKTQNVGVIGMGNLAQAITHYFDGKRRKLKIVAGFDVETSKIGTEIVGIKCYDIEKFVEICKREEIKIVLLTCPRSVATQLQDKIEAAEIKGVLNFTSASLNLSDDIYVEDYDIITLLEKVAYFSK